jgi:hypothetical protein
MSSWIVIYYFLKLCNLRCHQSNDESVLLDPVLGQLNLAHISKTYFMNIYMYTAFGLYFS